MEFLMSRWFCCCWILCLTYCLTGCAESKAPMVAVSGTVELDGKPMPEGAVTLIAETGDVPQTLDVKEGKFEGKSSVGKKRVEIRAYRMGKETKMGDTVIPAAPENYLPPQYNADSKIK